MTTQSSLGERCLGSPAKIRILTTLFLWKRSDLTERQLAKLCRLSTFGLRHALADLEGSLMITKKVVGRSHVWTLNEAGYPFQILKPVLACLANLPLPLQWVKRKLREGLPLEGVKRIVLFGSAVSGNFEEAGDVDIAILLKDSVKGEKQRLLLREAVDRISGEVGPLSGKRLEPHFFGPKDWDRTKGRSLGLSILRGKEIYPGEEI